MAAAFVLLTLLVLTVGQDQARAQGTGDVFKVTGVKVDATAETAARARDKALAEGQRAALNRLLDRIVLASDRPRLGQVSYATMTQLVRDFEVTNEKTSAVRYLAELNVRFKPNAVRDLLRSRNVAYAETRSKPVLVLPVYESGGAVSLWGSPNPWREAWATVPQADGLVPLVRPRGDVNDVATISAEQAVQGDAQRIATVARQYGAAEVLVATAGFDQGAAGEGGQPAQPSLRVTLRRFGGAGDTGSRSESFALRDGEEEGAALARAAAAIAGQIQEEWKENNRLQFGASRELTATVPISSLAEWLLIKRRLAGVAFIRQSDLLYLSRKEAWLRIRFIGNEQQLILALQQKDIVLEQGTTSWILRRAERRGNLAPAGGAQQAPVLSRPAMVPASPPASTGAPSALPGAPASPSSPGPGASTAPSPASPVPQDTNAPGIP